MKRKNRVLLVMIFCLWVFTTTLLQAEERAIYIGDLISLEISVTLASEADIREAFSIFDIVEFVKENERYHITFRSFQVGEFSIDIGGQEIMIIVESILGESGKESIYEGKYDLSQPGTTIYWNYIEYGFIGLFIFSLVLVLRRRLKNKRTKLLNYYEQANQYIDEISNEDEHYFVKLSAYLKWYIEKRFQYKMIGKTSKELILEVTRIENFVADTMELSQWLAQCDYHKFSGKAFKDIELEEKEIMKRRLKAILQSIEETRTIPTDEVALC